MVLRSIVCGAVAFYLLFAAQDGRAQQQCENRTINIGGQASTTRMCKGADGAWRRAEPAGASPGFRGSISYSGTHRAHGVGQARPSGRPGLSRDYSGAITIELTFDGQAVSGQVSGTGGVNGGPLSGVVSGGICKLYRGSVRFEGRCDATGFNGEIEERGNRMSVRGSFATTATQIVDFVERDRARAQEAARSQAAAAEQQAVAARELAVLKARAAAGNVAGMSDLGDAYHLGKSGASIDYKEAAKWYERAAAKGDGWSAARLAGYFYEGSIGPIDKAKSHQYYLRCAKSPPLSFPKNQQDFDLLASCMYNVAIDFYSGIGVVRNEAEGVRWYKACAARGKDKCIDWLNEHGASQ